MISLIAVRSLTVEKLFAFMLHACPSVYSDVYFCFFLLLLYRIPIWITKKKDDQIIRRKNKKQKIEIYIILNSKRVFRSLRRFQSCKVKKKCFVFTGCKNF